MKREIVVTEDGSHTLYISGMDEHYHSTHGAINESEHIYIGAGLKPAMEDKNQVAVLEIGFGTGLNALLTLREALASKIKMHYVTLEPYPLEKEIFTKLNYGHILDFEHSADALHKLHDTPWGMPYYFSDYFIFNKINISLEEVELADAAFDVVYYDAFAPGKQPEVWSEENFGKCFAALKHGGVLVTYSAQGQVKRNLQHVGFEVEKIPGPKGKREIIRARKN